MISHIAQFTVTVRDYDEAIRFYTDKLGFALLEDTDLGGGKRWVRVAPTGLSATGCDPSSPGRGRDASAGPAILLARAATPAQAASVGHQTGGRVFVFLETDDCRGDYQRLCSCGVTFVRPPSEEPYGVVAVFEDLYGNKFDLVERRSGGLG